MPLHPVPIIIGTTLAVIGGGMAFKKVRPVLPAALSTSST
jgi:hypothetical protein